MRLHWPRPKPVLDREPEPYDWSDFEPETPLQAVAYALMVAGVAYEQQPKTDLVRLDYAAAERFLDDLVQSGYAVQFVAHPYPDGLVR